MQDSFAGKKLCIFFGTWSCFDSVQMPLVFKLIMLSFRSADIKLHVVCTVKVVTYNAAIAALGDSRSWKTLCALLHDMRQHVIQPETCLHAQPFFPTAHGQYVLLKPIPLRIS